MNEIDIKEIRTKLGISQEKLAELVGVHHRTIQNWESGTKIPNSKSTILRSLIKSNSANVSKDSVQQEKNKEGDIKYFYQVESWMGNVTGTPNQNEVYKTIQATGFSDCVAINAVGDSMYPRISSGNILFVYRWMESFIEWGKIYLVITCSGRNIVKYLRPGSSDNKLLCVSENPNVEPFEIDRSDVCAIWRVKGWLAKDEQ